MTKDNNENSKVYDYLQTQGAIAKFFDKKKSSRIGSAFIYERIGEMERFVGCYPLLKGHIKALGNYTVVDYKGKMVYIENPVPEDFIPAKDPKIDKFIEVVKFAEDDFRIKNKVNENCYMKRKIPLTEEVVKEVDGEKVLVEEIKLDDDGNLVYEVEEILIPKASVVTQEGREAIRAGNEYELKMKEFMAKKEGFWSKNAVTIMGLTFMILMLVSLMFLGGKYLDRLGEMNSEFADNKQSQQTWWNKGFIDGVSERIERKEMEDNPPPQ